MLLGFLSLNFFFVKFWPTSWSHAFFFYVVCELKSSSLNICSVFGKKKTLSLFFLASNSFYVCLQIGFIFYIYTLTKPQHCHHQASHNIYCECLYWRLCHERVRSREDTVTVLWLLGHCCNSANFMKSVLELNFTLRYFTAVFICKMYRLQTKVKKEILLELNIMMLHC